jgi:hypothetical protein
MPRLIREQCPDSSHCGRFRQFIWPPECWVLCALCRNRIRVENSKVYIPSKEALIRRASQALLWADLREAARRRHVSGNPALRSDVVHNRAAVRRRERRNSEGSGSRRHHRIEAGERRLTLCRGLPWFGVSRTGPPTAEVPERERRQLAGRTVPQPSRHPGTSSSNRWS